MRSNSFQNKIILVTGATSGIGRAAALAFAKSGADVYGIARHAAGEVTNFPGGGRLTLCRGDVTDPASLQEVVSALPGIDIAVLAAGNGIAGPVEEVTADFAKKQMEVNYFGAINTCNVILPIMRRAGSGRVIFISSLAARVPIPMQSHYSSSKYALEALAMSLRMEIAPFGVRVSIVEPGDTKTGFTAGRVRYDDAASPYREVFRKSIARMEHDEQTGTAPEEVARVILSCAAKKNPPVRVPVGAGGKALVFLLRILPDRAVLFLLQRIYLPA
ncbi:MAG: SDR family oxidoreductase [Lachnospiraceae bacterium]